VDLAEAGGGLPGGTGLGDLLAGAGDPDGPAEPFPRSGASKRDNFFTVTVPHAFQTDACYWTVQATTDPTYPDGARTAQVLTRRCVLQ
jgi:hypothetical protein